MNQQIKQKPSAQYIEQLQTDGKAWYLTHPKASELTHQERETLKQATTEKSLRNLHEQDASQLTVGQCFRGTNVQTAMRVMEEATRAALVAMLVRCCKFIDANKTLNQAEDFEMALNELLRQYPALTIEDWRLCMYMMAKESFGPYYERLKLAQFVQCFAKYEDLRQPVIQTIRENETKDAQREQADARRYLQPEYATEMKPTIRDRVSKEDWLKGENRLTHTERQEMDNRHKAKQ